jgi:CheY-like chemotaxis protein
MGRLNVLLTQDRPRGVESWIEQLPRLLEPQGISTFVARSGEEALGYVEQVAIHAAVIDIATPMASPDAHAPSAVPVRATPHPGEGAVLIQRIRRLPHPPPIVVIHSPLPRHADFNRLHHDMLRLGAFTILQRPSPSEFDLLLSVFHRLVDRFYQGAWPGDPPKSPKQTPRPN